MHVLGAFRWSEDDQEPLPWINFERRPRAAGGIAKVVAGRTCLIQPQLCRSDGGTSPHHPFAVDPQNLAD
eukprot:3829749-Prorocentrum_lima.AAC.1